MIAAPYTNKGSLHGTYMLGAKLTINFHYVWTDYLSNFTITKKENKQVDTIISKKPGTVNIIPCVIFIYCVMIQY